MSKTILLTLLASSLLAQTSTGGLTPKGAFDASGATATTPAQTGSALPGTCTVGQIYFKTSATIGAYQCLTTTAWTLIGTSTNQAIRTIGATFGSFESGASALTGTKTACVPVYFSGTIQSVEVIGDVSGSATIGVLTVAHASWTGRASASSITASATPALSSAAVYNDSTLTGWTTAVAAGTDFCFAMSSPTTVAGLAIALKVAVN